MGRHEWQTRFMIARADTRAISILVAGLSVLPDHAEDGLAACA